MFACAFAGCDFTASQLSYVRGHARLHKGLTVYACSVAECSGHFATPRALRIHECWHAGERPYVCSVPGCDFSTANDKGLRVHIMRHNEIKPYACAECAYTCVTRPALVVHARNVHNTYPPSKVRKHMVRTGGKD